MRLTLRTLLAYLDDTLEPNQAKEIGQKVGESDTAQELITRIKQVTRRRRLTTPSDTGPGPKLDPNSIAGYLDNALDSDQLAEVEQTCLASDVHLAEVATCHQILTLVLGEPALIPPTAKQRMYALVKGREAIPFRKPPAASEPDEPPEGKEVDETLRLGLPALRRKGDRANWAVIGGGALALVACLVIAIVMLLRPGGTEDPDGPGPGKDGHAQARADKKKADADKTGKNGKDGSADKNKEENGTKKDNGKKGSGGKEKKGEQPGSGDDPSIGPPSPKVVEIGRFEPPSPPATAVLLQLHPGKDGGEWQRLERQAKPTRVWSGKPLVSLPTFRSTVLTDSGVRLTLWGTAPEFFSGPGNLNESLVVPHQSDSFDLDLTLQRGRIAVASTKGDKPLKVRVRFENSTDPAAQEMWDIVLEQQGAEVLMDRWGVYSPDEPFYPNPKDPNRVGPVAQVGLIVLNGSARVRVGDVTHDMRMPPGEALLFWNSVRGPDQARSLQTLPPFTSARPPLPKLDPKMNAQDQKALLKTMETQRTDLAKAAGQLNSDLLARAPELGLRKAMESNDPAVRKLAVRSYGALDMLPQLVDALGDKQHPDVRQAATDTLRHWCASSRDNDYRLLEELKTRYPAVEAGNIVALLHQFSKAALTRPETYDALITQLTTPQLALPARELAAWHLANLLGVSAEVQREIRAAPEMSPEELAKFRLRLRKILPKGTIPPQFDKGAGGDQ